MENKAGFGQRVANSRFFRKALRKAKTIAKNPEKLRALLDEATSKARAGKDGPLGEVWEYLMLLFRMLRAYLGGRYRDVSWQSLVAIVGALVYFVMPIDLIPDAVAGLGFADDAAVIAWTIQALREEIDRFSAWETGGAETVEDP